MALTAERKAELDRIIAQQQTQAPTAGAGLTPERKAELDRIIAQSKGTQPTVAEPKKEGFLSSLASPFKKTIASGMNLLGALPSALGGVADLISGDGNDEFAKMAITRAGQDVTKERDFGIFGKARPVTINQQTGQALTPGRAVLDTLGTGIELGSFLAPGGEAISTGAKGVLNTATNIAKGGLLPAFKTGAKFGALGAGTGSLGMALQDQNATVGNVAAKTLLGTAGGAVLGGALGTVAPLLGKALNKDLKVAGQQVADNKLVAKSEKELLDLIKKNSSLNKLYTTSKAKGGDPIRFIAEKNFLGGSVDADGVIRTMEDGGAINRLNDFLKPAEGIMADLLDKEASTLSLDELESALLNAVKKSDMEGSALKGALSRIESDMSGYRMKDNGVGRVGLGDIHRFKVSKYANINYLNPENGKVDKLIAKTLKELVEKNSKEVPVKEINKELQTYYSAQKLLERLDGKRVAGGRLGKYFAQVLGSVAGSSIGGPMGSIAGAELAGRLQSKILQGKFGKATEGLLKMSDNMLSAIKSAKEPRKIAGLLEYAVKSDYKPKFGQPGFVPPASKSLTQSEIRMDMLRRGMTNVGETDEELQQVMRELSGGSKDDLLLAEAKKYNSADEFVKAQGTPVYHGTRRDFEEFNLSNSGKAVGGKDTEKAIFFDEDPKNAELFGRKSRPSNKADEGFGNTHYWNHSNGVRVIDSFIDKGSKILDFDFKNQPFDIEIINPLFEKAITDGYDGVRLGNVIDNEVSTLPSNQIAIFNLDKVKTKPQLEGIWSKANKQATGADTQPKMFLTASKIDSIIDKYIDDFRKEYNMMADNRGAGLIFAGDDTGSNTRFSLKKAKGMMRRQSDLLKKEAHDILMKTDPVYQRMIEIKSSIKNNTPVPKIDNSIPF